MGSSTVIADGWGWHFGADPSRGIIGGSFTLVPGERVLLLGPSGSGKSTLLRAIAGLLDESEGQQRGSLTVSGVPSSRARGRVGLVLQDPQAQTIAARIGDDVAFGCENLGVPQSEIWSRVHEALDAVNLALPLSHPTSHLSGGEKQRLAIAGALAMRPEVLLMDEPTANLDSSGAELVRDATLAAVSAAELSLVVVDHNLDLWLPHVTRVLMLDARGELVLDTSVSRALREHRDLLETLGVWLPGAGPHAPAGAVPTARPATSSSLMLSADRLDVAHPRQAHITLDFTADFHESEFVALTGENGSGKTTLALTLGGLLAPARGNLRASADMAGSLRPHPHRWSSRQLVTRIGSVFQSPEHQFVRSSVRDELSLGVSLAGLTGAVARNRIDELLTRLHLDAHADAHPFALSGGQQRRLSVGAVIASAPRVLIIDEPTFGQDAHTWRELVSLLADQLNAGTTVIASTHDTRLVERAHGALRIGARS